MAQLFDRRIVDHRHAVPQQIASGRPDQQRPLADRERRLRSHAQQVHLGAHLVVVLLAQAVKRGPALPGPADVLPLVLADRASIRLVLARRELHATGGADEAGVHPASRYWAKVIPYSADDAPDPTSATPVVTAGLIAVNFIVFFYELALSARGSLDSFLYAFSLVPCEYTGHCAAYAGTPSPFWLTLFSSMFLHAGWAHILGNMVFLFVFGIHVERSMGGLRYLIFYLICGLGANALEIATAAGSNLPGLGASGAISGVLAAYLVLYPSSHVKTLIPIGFFFWTARLPAWLFIGFWFVMQIVFGLADISTLSSGVP